MRRAAGKDLVEHSAHCVQVCPGSDVFAANLLRRQIGWCTQNVSVLSEPTSKCCPAGQAKVEHRGTAVRIYENVGWLEIAMEDARRMNTGQYVEKLYDRGGDIGPFVRVVTTWERFAIDQLHNQEWLITMDPFVEQLHDSRQSQQPQRSDLPPHTSGLEGATRQQFDRYGVPG